MFRTSVSTINAEVVYSLKSLAYTSTVLEVDTALVTCHDPLRQWQIWAITPRCPQTCKPTRYSRQRREAYLVPGGRCLRNDGYMFHLHANHEIDYVPNGGATATKRMFVGATPIVVFSERRSSFRWVDEEVLRPITVAGRMERLGTTACHDQIVSFYGHVTACRFSKHEHDFRPVYAFSLSTTCCCSTLRTPFLPSLILASSILSILSSLHFGPHLSSAHSMGMVAMQSKLIRVKHHP
jgi:hypothetical protein